MHQQNPSHLQSVTERGRRRGKKRKAALLTFLEPCLPISIGRAASCIKTGFGGRGSLGPRHHGKCGQGQMFGHTCHNASNPRNPEPMHYPYGQQRSHPMKQELGKNLSHTFNRHLFISSHLQAAYVPMRGLEAAHNVTSEIKNTINYPLKTIKLP